MKLRKRACSTKQHGSVPARPARVVGTSNLSDGNVLLTNAKHPVNTLGAPSFVITSKGDGRGAQGACVLEWPWDRPATVVTSRPGLAPPGHHDESFAVMSLPDAIVLSERAAAILQGFPETWIFAGKTKRSRWSQIGMAVPPQLAEAVARSIVAALRDTGDPITSIPSARARSFNHRDKLIPATPEKETNV